jgi:hypothetical protein
MLTASNKKWVKMSNSLILDRICFLVRFFNINLVLTKVKAHDGILGNERADQLAKEGLYSHRTFTCSFNSSSKRINFFPEWNGFPIETKFRKFVVQLFDDFNEEEWTRLSHHDEVFTTNLYRDFHWDCTWQLFKKYSQFNCDHFSKHARHIFLIKLFTKLLPLGNILKQRKPSLYTDLRCPSCSSQNVEDWNHLRSCSGLQEAYDDVFERTSNDWKQYLTTYRFRHKESGSDPLNLKIVEQQINLLIVKLLGHNANSVEFRSFCRWSLECKILKIDTQFVKETMALTPSSLIAVSVQLLDIFINNFFQFVWKLRNSNMLSWEEAHNISTRMKHRSLRSNEDDAPLITRALQHGYSDMSEESYRPQQPNHRMTRNERQLQCLPNWRNNIKDYIKHYVTPVWTSRSMKVLKKTLEKATDIFEDNGSRKLEKFFVPS